MKTKSLFASTFVCLILNVASSHALAENTKKLTASAAIKPKVETKLETKTEVEAQKVTAQSAYYLSQLSEQIDAKETVIDNADILKDWLRLGLTLLKIAEQNLNDVGPSFYSFKKSAPELFNKALESFSDAEKALINKIVSDAEKLSLEGNA